MITKLKIWMLKKYIERNAIMKKTLEFLQNKKTYITAAVIGITAAAEALGYEVPDSVYKILGALGLVALRAGVTKSGAVKPA